MRAALVQLRSCDDPAANLPVTLGLLAQAAEDGAELILTPECTNMVSASRARQDAALTTEAQDLTLTAIRKLAVERGVCVLIGSLLLKTGDADGRFANRSFLIGPDGAIRVRYDKIHMFDVDLGAGETYRESARFRPGDRAVTADVCDATLGLTLCYDMRFPGLYRDLAKAGAQVLTVPSAFTVPTGRVHWEVLLRARAIETGCFVLAPAQGGVHSACEGAARETWGHSLAVSPWGEILAEAGTDPCVTMVDIDLAEVARARGRIPSLGHDRVYAGPAPD
jgi:predicted amidohydrolase